MLSSFIEESQTSQWIYISFFVPFFGGGEWPPELAILHQKIAQKKLSKKEVMLKIVFGF